LTTKHETRRPARVPPVSEAEEILEHQRLRTERSALYASFGYDVDRERDFVIEKARPFGGNILEAGTGKGDFALALAKKGYRLVTFDISEEQRHAARLHLKSFGLDGRVDFRLENGEQLSFADASFDTIFSVNTLHHLRNPSRFIDELLRVLSPGGKLILSDFTEEGMAMMDDIHGRSGEKHEASSVRLSDVGDYLEDKGYALAKGQSRFQVIFIARKK
jgi:ubiquinone/menaquinone biosynthesis C-methylase UbiE